VLPARVPTIFLIVLAGLILLMAGHGGRTDGGKEMMKLQKVSGKNTTPQRG
jgi:hypothetical protein